LGRFQKYPFRAKTGSQTLKSDISRLPYGSLAAMLKSFSVEQDSAACFFYTVPAP
jgi:hypothetical protein